MIPKMKQIFFQSFQLRKLDCNRIVLISLKNNKLLAIVSIHNLELGFRVGILKVDFKVYFFVPSLGAFNFFYFEGSFVWFADLFRHFHSFLWNNKRTFRFLWYVELMFHSWYVSLKTMGVQVKSVAYLTLYHSLVLLIIIVSFNLFLLISHWILNFSFIILCF